MSGRHRSRRHRARNQGPWSSLVFGLAVLGAGAIFWLDHLERIDAGDYLMWWPVAVVALGLGHVADRQWVSGIIFTLIGAAFLGPLIGYDVIRLDDVIALFPLLISAAGVALVMQALRPVPGGGKGVHMMAFMAGNVRRLGAEEFVGADAIAVMGGCEIDLSSARITDQGIIDVLAFWGGIEIRVPRGWRVVSRTTTLMGSFNDQTDGGAAGAPQLVIRGTVIMGGVEVKNGELAA